MKRIIFLIILTVTTITLLATNNLINSFRAFSNGSNITVEWRTNDETNLKQFELQRSSNNSIYTKIKTIDPNNKASDYKYVDEEALFKNDGNDPKTQSGKVYSYRLKMLFNDGTVDYSESISVTHQTNSIRRTWGMIKELFR